jgi:hypothetical protein
MKHKRSPLFFGTHYVNLFSEPIIHFFMYYEMLRIKAKETCLHTYYVSLVYVLLCVFLFA